MQATRSPCPYPLIAASMSHQVMPWLQLQTDCMAANDASLLGMPHRPVQALVRQASQLKRAWLVHLEIWSPSDKATKCTDCHMQLRRTPPILFPCVLHCNQALLMSPRASSACMQFMLYVFYVAGARIPA